MLSFLVLFLLPIFFLFRRKKYSGRLPPGSLGLPLIGQTLDLLNALKADRVDVWFQKRISKHGPIWKANLFGYSTVVIHGTSANKFIYTSDGNLLSSSKPPSTTRIMGPRNIFELSGLDHVRVRAALVSFLKLDVLKQYSVIIDEEVQHSLEEHWHGQTEIKVQPLIKTLTFNVICSLLFGIERGPKREKLLPVFQDMIEGLLAIPINLPFTQFNRGIQARKKMVPMLIDLIHEKREELVKQKQQNNPHKDLITAFLSIRDDDSMAVMSDEEINDNIIIVMLGGYDTTSILITFLVKLLASNNSIYSEIAQEQEEIARSKAPGESLTWEDLAKMKYTWRVASEVMRITPPVSLGFRRAKQDIEYEGYIIPKGWQVLFAPFMTHMDKDIFQNPTIFDPAHFETSPLPYSYVPFGAGPRMCPGIELAKMETLAMMHRLVTRFRWKLVDKEESFKRIPMPEFDQGLTNQKVVDSEVKRKVWLNNSDDQFQMPGSEGPGLGKGKGMEIEKFCSCLIVCGCLLKVFLNPRLPTTHNDDYGPTISNDDDRSSHSLLRCYIENAAIEA
ncbi:cytochrome P450 716B1-like protein [Tanacetum coccineum]